MADTAGQKPREVREVRVHGVGGSHGPKMLGYDSANDVIVVGEGVGGTSILARQTDRSVESYDWGDLTSGSGTRAFWVLLLPFTLVNIAGWMHPPVDRTSQRKVTWVRGLVHLLSLAMTATYVFTLGIILVDLAGWQWSRRLALPKDPTEYPAPSTLGAQQRGVVFGLIALAIVVALVFVLAGKSQVRFEKTEPSPLVKRKMLTGRERWGKDERVSGPGFFHHPTAARRLLYVHLAAAVVSLLLVAAWSVYQAFVRGDKPERLDVGTLQAFCTAIVINLILALFVVSWRNGRQAGERWVKGSPAIAATLGFALVNAVSSGAILLLLKRFNDWPKRPDAALDLTTSRDVVMVDVWGFIVLVLGIVAAVIWLRLTFLPPAVDVNPRNSNPGRPLDGADTGYRRTIAKSRWLADLAHRASGVAVLVVLLLVTADVVMIVYRVFFTNPGSLLMNAPEELNGPFFRAGTYALPALVVVLIQLVRKGQGGARTFASTLWDVLTFWPRRFSPLAVRPYSERAVPELQGRTIYHARERDRGVVVSAHSQGSILAFAALAPLEPDDLRHVALVTYGSPITSIFATFFPAYFGTGEVERLRDKLPDPGPEPSPELHGWRNFYRRTDPIGGPVFRPADDPGDCELHDPFEGPGSTDEPPTTPPREHDRPVWSQLAVHSYYEREPVLKAWVRTVREALASR